MSTYIRMPMNELLSWVVAEMDIANRMAKNSAEDSYDKVYWEGKSDMASEVIRNIQALMVEE